MRFSLLYVVPALVGCAHTIALGDTRASASRLASRPLDIINTESPVHDRKDDRPPHDVRVRGPQHNLRDNEEDWKVVILADSNRDGRIDVTGNTDLQDKEIWTKDRGALFLANIADTGRRCSSAITGSCGADLGDVFSPSLPQEPKLNGKTYNQVWDDLLRIKADNNGSWDQVDAKKNSPEYVDFFQRYRDWKKEKVNPDFVARCHDASDNEPRNATYLAPLRTIPNPRLRPSASGSIAISDNAAASKVRLFHKRAGSWLHITSNYTFSATDMINGLELGIDGRDVRRPGGWDGKALVTFTVKDGTYESSNSVALRMAPLLIHHHGQAAQQVLTSLTPREAQKEFVERLKERLTDAGMMHPMHVFDTDGCRFGALQEMWTQDFFEPGYMSIPRPDGPVSLRVMIRSAQSDRDARRLVFRDLRSGTVGAIQHLGDGQSQDTTESTGNVEIIPPYSHGAKSFPAGRAVVGSQDGTAPRILALPEAQELQQPIRLDTSWLMVGHVDEFMQFLPTKTELGWVMAVDDPLAGLKLLQEAQQAGHGESEATSRFSSPGDPSGACVPSDTISQVLGKEGFASVQSDSAKQIQKNVDMIKAETGLTDADIVRVPALYYYADSAHPHWTCRTDSKKRRQLSPSHALHDDLDETGNAWQGHDSNILGESWQIPVRDNSTTEALPSHSARDAATQVISLYPGTINNIVLGNSKIIAPNPFGPIVADKDIFATAVSEAYARANHTVLWMDDWYSHHVKLGEIHCGTNTIREMGGSWW